jgi:hypothetical protein
MQNPPVPQDITPYTGVWRGVVKGKMISITLDTTNQSRKPVGWYSWYEPGKEIEEQNNFSFIGFDGSKGVITLHAHKGSEEIVIVAWVNATTMLGLNEEIAVMLVKF